MGLFGSLFGSSSKGNTSQQTTQTGTTTGTANATESKTESGTQSGSSTTQQTAQNQQQTTLLDKETQDILQGLLASIAGGAGPGGTTLPPELQGASGDILDFAGLLGDRAGGAEASLNADNAAILSEAKRQGTNTIEAGTRRAAEGAGSNLNSIVLSAEASGKADLESRLGALSADLNFRSREMSTQELLSAFGALTEGAKTGTDVTLAGQGQGVANVSNLANVLKGATAETTGGTTTTGTATSEQQFNQLAELIRQATENSTTNTEQIGNTVLEQRNNPGLLQSVFPKLFG